MANIRSQIKRNRQNERRRQRNKAVRSEIRTRSRVALEAVDGAVEHDEATTLEAARIAMKRIDKAAAKGVIHKNEASRRKSRLARRLNAAAGE